MGVPRGLGADEVREAARRQYENRDTRSEAPPLLFDAARRERPRGEHQDKRHDPTDETDEILQREIDAAPHGSEGGDVAESDDDRHEDESHRAQIPTMFGPGRRCGVLARRRATARGPRALRLSHGINLLSGIPLPAGWSQEREGRSHPRRTRSPTPSDCRNSVRTEDRECHWLGSGAKGTFGSSGAAAGKLR